MINIFIQINKDLKDIKSRNFGPFTKRQAIFIVIGCVIGLVIYALLYKIGLSTTGCMMSSIIAAFIPFSFSVDVPGKLPLEKILKYMILRKIRPSVRTYKTENIYSIIDSCAKQQEIYEKEMKISVGKQNQNTKNKKTEKQSSKVSAAKHTVH